MSTIVLAVAVVLSMVGPDPRGRLVRSSLQGGRACPSLRQQGKEKDKMEALGELLNGDRLVSMPYQLNFMKDKDVQVVCKKHLTKEEVAQFRSAIGKDYYFQMYYDDLPIWGFIGKVDKDSNDPNEYKYYLYKHIHFDILYNNDRVTEINARTNRDTLVDLTEDKEVEFEFV
ncbi:hypothetical protein MLD38_026253 [Melastoma candidum]|uniref:Uncharacterized protein n=1 Tax=Melastoma candidum TaxID=119954 RepID=A0ACB9NZK4_9MYRT|nr:hypothetical protein MLD38_026253 [Melastoma candidum]